MAPNIHADSPLIEGSDAIYSPPTHKRESELFPRINPPFTVGDLKRAVPAQCFQPTLVESFSHLFKDLAEVSFYIAVMSYLDAPLWEASPVAWGFAWLIYTWMQGVVFTGVWVIAHECGHGAFSTSSTINDAVGFVLHTCLSVPYFSWQHTHANHHHFTNNLQKDEVFVPRKKTQVELTSAYKTMPKNTLFNFIQLTFMLLLGWPLYLLINTSGHHSDTFNSHFVPTSSIFTKKERVKVVASDLGLIAWWTLLYTIGQHLGSGLLFRLYVLPLLVNNAFLVAITYMQHTHADVPHYDSTEWTWLRGALCTVDRTMGKYLDNKLHLIHVTHVLHHIFPQVPFYRSKVASDAIIKVLGKYYKKDDGNFLYDMWDNAIERTFLEEGEGILFWLHENH